MSHVYTPNQKVWFLSYLQKPTDDYPKELAPWEGYYEHLRLAEMTCVGTSVKDEDGESITLYHFSSPHDLPWVTMNNDTNTIIPESCRRKTPREQTITKMCALQPYLETLCRSMNDQELEERERVMARYRYEEIVMHAIKHNHLQIMRSNSTTVEFKPL